MHHIAWYGNFIDKVDVKFIQTQRLITLRHKKISPRENRTGYEDTVTNYALELRNFIRDKLSESVQISQSLDSTFPSRLLNKGVGLDFNEGKIIKLSNQLEGIRNELETVGLIKTENVLKIQEGSMAEIDQKAIYLYLTDSLKKYAMFDDLVKKLTLFTQTVNKKFNGSKKIIISKDKGIEVITKLKEQLDHRLLSSGEQHEIILLYDLIFKTTKNTLVLIDEPEISLHIDWQMSFLDDLEAIAKLSNPQFLIATHSPSIIGNRHDLCQEIEA